MACAEYRIPAKAAADFIEQAPHQGSGRDLPAELQKTMGLYQLLYWLTVIALILVLWLVCHIPYAWILGLLANFVWPPLSRKLEENVWRKLTEKKE